MAYPQTVQTVTPAASIERVTGTSRLTSLDAFRGATMLFMASEIMRIPSLARAFPESSTARFLSSMLDHRAWVGCAPWDLIQPAFMFMVGVSLPFSIASRRAKGHGFQRMFVRSIYRALMLIALGIFLRSQGRSQTYFTFEDVLTQIGLGYVVLFLLAWTRPKVQWAAAAAILIGYWAAFALYPLPAPGFDTTTVGVPRDWPHHLTGFAQHWDKNTNLANAVDVWFLNLFPRQTPFLFNRGGYLTLNFVPSLATMIFGLLAGGWLRARAAGSDRLRPDFALPASSRSRRSATREGGQGYGGSAEASAKAEDPAPQRSDRGLADLRPLILFGIGGIVLGAVLHFAGICPIVKRIWTPSWTLYSAGWVTLLLAGCYYVIDVLGHRRWAFPLLVVGMNSIAMYVIVHVATDYMFRMFTIHFGGILARVHPAFLPIVLGAATLTVFWLILYWMYRQRVFVRI